MSFFDQEEKENPKLRKTDRKIFLRPIEGKFASSSSGLIDKRLFDEGNFLIATMDKQTCLWSMHYDKGGLPEPLKQQFVSFKQLRKYVEWYFKKRNIEIIRVED